LKRKKSSPQLLEETENCLETERTAAELEKLVKISLKGNSQDERVLEASKPLYLRRYE
jgi:capsular polysaccharide biosynthesis protein